MFYKFAPILGLVVTHSLYAGNVLIEGPETTVSVSEMNTMLLTVPDHQKQELLASPTKLKKLLDAIYINKVVAERGRKSGLNELESVRAEIWKAEQNALTGAQLNKVVEDAAGSVENYDVLAKEYYLVNKEEFRTAEEIEASHILVKGEGEDVLDTASGLKKKIESNEISFEDAARKYSEDSGSSEKGGNLGRFGKGRMVKPFEEAAFALQNVGEISDPVKSRFGYHLIRLDARYPAGIRDFDEVRISIRDDLYKKSRKSARESYILEIQNDPRARFNSEAFDAYVADLPGNK